MTSFVRSSANGKELKGHSVEHPQEKAQEYDDQQLSTEDLEAIKQWQEDIKQGRCLTLEEYRRGKRL